MTTKNLRQQIKTIKCGVYIYVYVCVCMCVCVCVCVCVSFSVVFNTPTLCNPMDCHQAALFMGFSWQEYWNRLPFPSPGDLPNQGIKPRFTTLQADSLLSEPSEKPHTCIHMHKCEMNSSKSL